MVRLKAVNRCFNGCMQQSGLRRHYVGSSILHVFSCPEQFSGFFVFEVGSEQLRLNCILRKKSDSGYYFNAVLK